MEQTKTQIKVTEDQKQQLRQRAIELEQQRQDMITNLNAINGALLLITEMLQ